MKQELKDLPDGYRHQIAKELGCSVSMVSEVVSQIRRNNTAHLNSILKLNILKALKRTIDEVKATKSMASS